MKYFSNKLVVIKSICKSMFNMLPKPMINNKSRDTNSAHSAQISRKPFQKKKKKKTDLSFIKYLRSLYRNFPCNN